MIGYDVVLRGLIMPKYGTVNHIGMDLDDLKNTVELHLWEKGHGKLLNRPLAYVMAKNKLIDVQRSDVREADNRRLMAPLLLDRMETDIERELFSKEAIELLRVVLTEKQWIRLKLGLENDFIVKRMWLSEKTFISYEYYLCKFRRLISYCRKVLNAADIYNSARQTINKLEV